MDNIIVTATNLTKSYMYDLEVPTNLTIDKLKDDMVETLNGYNPDLFLSTAVTELFCNRLGRNLLSHETLESAGVWNGDYITVLDIRAF